MHINANPDFMILGVTKCGTTSLYDYLCKHPNILHAQRKELHFFDNRKFKKGLECYNKKFPKTAPGQLTGEASPGYFWKKRCLRRIKNMCPNTKFIVIFRNPVKRIISEYFRLVRRGREHACFDKAIHKPGLYDRYISAGMYIEHINRWLTHFPKEQFLFLILEDLIANPEKEVNKVFTFLGLKEYKLDSYEIKNKGEYKSSDINQKTIDGLYKVYEPYNKALEQFLNRTLPWGQPKAK